MSYTRFDQNPERQLEHVPVDRLFTDKASGKDTLRPELDALLSFVREGDAVVVHSMDRLARNLDDLRRLVQKLTGDYICSISRSSAASFGRYAHSTGFSVRFCPFRELTPYIPTKYFGALWG